MSNPQLEPEPEQPYIECPVCGDCGNWTWAETCGRSPRKSAPFRGGFKGQKSTQSVSEGEDT